MMDFVMEKVMLAVSPIIIKKATENDAEQ